MAACGTYAGYQRHHYYGETPCQPCRDAMAAYQRAWIAANPQARDKRRGYARARSRAVARLIAAHRGEFVVLFAEERAKEGL